MIVCENTPAATKTDTAQMWEGRLRKIEPGLENLNVVDWVQNKSGRILILGQEELVYCRTGKTRRSLVRWILKLQHISSIITVGYTVVISYTESVSMGQMRLDVPAWHTVACQQEAIVELVMQRVNRALSDAFEKHYVKDRTTVSLPCTSCKVSSNFIACCHGKQILSA